MAPPPRFYAIIAGVGSGTGRSCALRFSKTYPVVLLARHPESYEPIVAEIQAAQGHAIGIPADVADASSLASAFETIAKELPDANLAAAVFNVGSPFVRKPFLQQTKTHLDNGLLSVHGFFNFAQKTLPLLEEALAETPAHPPTLILTGATASLKGSAHFSTFAVSKFSQRAMCQSIAREFAPKGVHVVHAIIDGIIDTEVTRDMTVNGGVADGKLNPEHIAETYWNMHAQDRSVFTHEIDLRPFVEKF